MSGKSTIPEVTAWLERLQQAAEGIRSAGLAAGANQATRDGFRATHDASGAHVAFRGKQRMDSVEPAIARGLSAEFARRAQ